MAESNEIYQADEHESSNAASQELRIFSKLYHTKGIPCICHLVLVLYFVDIIITDTIKVKEKYIRMWNLRVLSS